MGIKGIREKIKNNLGRIKNNDKVIRDKITDNAVILDQITPGIASLVHRSLHDTISSFDMNGLDFYVDKSLEGSSLIFTIRAKKLDG